MRCYRLTLIIAFIALVVLNSTNINWFISCLILLLLCAWVMAHLTLASSKMNYLYHLFPCEEKTYFICKSLFISVRYRKWLNHWAVEKKKNYSLVYLSYPERIHQAQAAAAKARKALQQKPKPAAKPVSPQEKKQTKTQQHLLGEITIYQLLFWLIFVFMV